MSDVRQAAERLRRLASGESPEAVYGVPCVDLRGGGKMWARESIEQHFLDQRAVIAAYLAEHPADDEVELDDQWVLCLRGTPLFVDWCDIDGWHIAVNSDYHGIHWTTFDKVFKARGDVRRIAAALGIELGQ